MMEEVLRYFMQLRNDGGGGLVPCIDEPMVMVMSTVDGI
jgi:hypothetical protein